MELEVVVGLTFILFLVVILIYSIWDLFTLRTTSPEGPSTNTCTVNSLYLAWIRGLLSPSSCPDYVNRYYVENRILKERQLKVDERCCWFDEEDSKVVSVPFICNAMAEGSLTDDDLNQKPYDYQAGSVQYLNPSCETKDCISLTNIGGSEYVISKYNLRQTNEGVEDSLITLDSMCSNLSSYKINGEEKISISPSGAISVLPGSPQVVRDIVTAYNRTKGFYPVPITSLI